MDGIFSKLDDFVASADDAAKRDLAAWFHRFITEGDDQLKVVLHRDGDVEYLQPPEPEEDEPPPPPGRPTTMTAQPESATTEAVPPTTNPPQATGGGLSVGSATTAKKD